MHADSNTCKEVRQRLTAFIDHELATEDTSIIRRHLEACVDCRERVEVERSFTAALRARRLREQAPPWLMEKVRQAIEREASGPARLLSFGRLAGWRPALAVAGYALALLFALLWLGRLPSPLQPGDMPVAGRQPPAARPHSDGQAGANGPVGEADGRLWMLASMRLKGQVVCVICDRAGVPVEQQILCDTYGHYNGLRDDRGRMWLMVHNQGKNAVLEDPGMRGRTVDVEAEVFEDEGYLIAWNVHEL